MTVPSNIANVGWAWQSVKGTPAGASANRLWLSGGEQPHAETVKEDFEETTGLRMLQDAYISTAEGTGSPEHFVMPDSIGSLLYGVLGGQAITGAGDPWTHTLTPANTLPYGTVWRSIGQGLFERFTDCKLGHLKIHGESGKPLRVTPTWMGGTSAFLTAEEVTAAIEKTNRYMHYDASAALKVEGTAVASIRSFDIDIDNGAQTVPGDSLGPNDTSEGRFTIEVAVVMLVADFQLYNRIHYGSATPSNLAPHTTSPLELAGSPAGLEFTWTRVAASRTLKIAIPRVQVDPFSDQPAVDGNPLTRSLTYRAYQPAAGNSITGTVLNAKSTTY
jgi:Phage tail tube protein